MKYAVATTLAFALALPACARKDEPPKPVSAVPTPAATTQPASTPPATDKPAASMVVPRNLALGTAIGPDKKITTPADTLTAKDTAYVSVDLYGAGDAKVSATWTAAGKPVKTDTQTVKVSAPTTVEFHLAEPAGLAPGNYDVDLVVNDVSAGKQKFTVK